MNILNKLTLKNLKVHKKQTITTIVAVSLACTLFFVIGIIVSSFLNQSIKETIANNSDYHFNINRFKYTDIEKVKQIEDLKSIKIFGQILSDKIDEETINIYKLDDTLFNEIDIIDGKLPSNNSEVITTQIFLDNLDLHLNDELVLTKSDKVYKIVGVFAQKNGLLGSVNPYNAFYTKESFTDNDYVSAVITLNHTNKNIVEQANKINSILNYEKDEMNKNVGGISYNTDYLSYKGITTSYDSQLSNAIFTILAIVLLTIVGFICYFIIYNSFEISLNERKNMIGIFSSLGATPQQIVMSVFLESFIITIISIIIGFIFSYLLSFGLFSFVNISLDGIMSSKMDVSFNLTYMAYSLLFIILTVLLASFSMTVKAKKISPIALIRNTETIKNKQLKTNHLFLKIFGIEGEYARKNMKRNKRKYHITVISMVISIILFSTFAGVMQYVNSIIKKINPYNNTDITISLPSDSKIINDIRKIKSIDSKIEYHMEILNTNNLSDYYSDDYKKGVSNNSLVEQQGSHKVLVTIVINDNDYEKLIKSINLKNIDYFITGNYSINDKNIKIFNDNKIDSLNLCKDRLIYEESSKILDNDCKYKINDIPVIYEDINLFAFQTAVYMNETYFETISDYARKYDDSNIKDQSILEKIMKINNNKRLQIIIKSKNYKKFDKEIKEIFKLNNIDFSQGTYDYYNPYMEMDNQINLINTIQIAVYIIIFYIMGIALLSVYNTVESSLELRKREFATLKSIGMDKKGFNKITIFESIILSLKAIIYAIPFIYVILIVIYKVFNLGQTIGGEVDAVYSSVKPPYLIIGCSFVVISVLVYIINKTINKKIKTEEIINTIK